MKIKMVAVPIILAVVVFGAPFNAFAEGDGRDSDSPFGVLAFLPWNHFWNNYFYDSDEKIEKSAMLMKEAGVGFARMDFLWYDIEPSKGVFDFKKHDRIVDILNKNNVRVLGILHYNPTWDNEPWNKAPDAKLYARYAAAVVNHFKDRVRYWEIWNEPDEKTYWVPQDDMKAYAELLKTVYPVMKKADPTCKVLMGGVSKTQALSLKRIYKNGGKDYFDIVNIHIFVSPLNAGAIGIAEGIYKGVYKVMQEFGDENKKIWFTEIGCPGVKTPNKNNGWWEGLGPTEEQQALWVKEVYTNCLKWENVDKVFWAFFRDTDNYYRSGVDYFGLIRPGFTKKPAYMAYKKIAKKEQ